MPGYWYEALELCPMIKNEIKKKITKKKCKIKVDNIRS